MVAPIGQGLLMATGFIGPRRGGLAVITQFIQIKESIIFRLVLGSQLSQFDQAELLFVVRIRTMQVLPPMLVADLEALQQLA
jgi:hypothetical protein